MHRDSRGVVYVVHGARAQYEAGMSIKSLRLDNDLPVTVVGDEVEGADNDVPFVQIDYGGRWTKVNLDWLSPYEYTLYIDADARPHANLSAGFEVLDDGWDMAVCPSMMQDDEFLWHVGDEERQYTVEKLGYTPLQLQAGVMFFRKNERVRGLFGAWRLEWTKYQDQDQGALLRALAKSPVRLWVLGPPWNGGAVIDHRFGVLRSKADG